MKYPLIFPLLFIAFAAACIGAETTEEAAEKSRDKQNETAHYQSFRQQLAGIVKEENEINGLLCQFYDLEEKRNKGTLLALSDPEDDHYARYIDILLNVTQKEINILKEVERRSITIQQEIASPNYPNISFAGELENIPRLYRNYSSSLLAGTTHWIQALESVKRNLRVIRDYPEEMDDIENTRSLFDKGIDLFSSANKTRQNINMAIDSINKALIQENERPLVIRRTSGC